MQQDTLRIIGVVLVLVGAGIGIWGVGWYQSGSDCDPYYLSAQTTYSDYADTPIVDYQNLTDGQQRTFRQTLATEDNYRGFSEPHFDTPTRVRYEGETYLVLLAVSDGCQPLLDLLLRVIPLMAGIGGIFGGFFLLYRNRQEGE